MQLAAQHHVDLLEAAADTQQRDAGVDHPPHQRQCGGVARLVVQGAGTAGHTLIVVRLDIGRRTRQQDAVHQINNSVQLRRVTQRRDQHGHAAGRPHRRGDVLLAHRVEGKQAYGFDITRDADNRLHGYLGWFYSADFSAVSGST
ncbi:hypothetical protein D3C72_2045150 [compost metagenome]